MANYARRKNLGTGRTSYFPVVFGRIQEDIPYPRATEALHIAVMQEKAEKERRDKEILARLSGAQAPDEREVSEPEAESEPAESAAVSAAFDQETKGDILKKAGARDLPTIMSGEKLPVPAVREGWAEPAENVEVSDVSRDVLIFDEELHMPEKAYEELKGLFHRPDKK